MARDFYYFNSPKEQFDIAMKTYQEKKRTIVMMLSQGYNMFSKDKESCDTMNQYVHCFNYLLLSADGGYEPAIKVVLRDVLTDDYIPQISKRVLLEMIEKQHEKQQNEKQRNGGMVIYSLLGDLEEDNCVMQRQYYRKSMEKGFILGKYKFARLMYSKNLYSLALKYYKELLEDPHYEWLHFKIKGHILNDISLCHYYNKNYKSFLKYNDKARILLFGLHCESLLAIILNNAANAHFRGNGTEENVQKALDLYKEARLKLYYLFQENPNDAQLHKTQTEWIDGQIIACQALL
jgi:hypothetical protein